MLHPMEVSRLGAPKTLFIQKAPKDLDYIDLYEEIDVEETSSQINHTYNEEESKINMNDVNAVSRMMRNINSNDEDWEERLHKFTWTPLQSKIFKKVADILDSDHLARLANAQRSHEAVQRRVTIDKSVERMRKVLASISWDIKLIQWLHALLQDNLPQAYLAVYMDILQSLNAKVPALADRILFERPGSMNQDLVGYAVKKPWEPQVSYKNRKLPNSPFIVVAPAGPSLTGKASLRMQQWYALLTTMAAVIPIQVPATSAMKDQPLQTITDQMVFVTRSKIQEIRQEAPDRPIILLGFNAGAALALQVGLVENVNCIVTLGFAYNTINGHRGTPDDHILDVNVPVLFVVGQDAARSSPEEISSLREKMQTQTSMVVVGSADDSLRIGKTKRRIEGITQSMVDNSIIDEVASFCTKCLENPVKIKIIQPVPLNSSMHNVARKRKSESDPSDRGPKKLGRPRLEKTGLTPPSKPKEMKERKMISMKPPTPMEIHTPDTVMSPAIATEPPRREDFGMKVLETKKLSPIPVIKTDAGVTQLEIKPSQTMKQLITFPGTGPKPQMIKLVPPNQFIQLKPNTASTPQGTRIVTLKSTTAPIRTTPTMMKATTIAPGAKIYTLKPNASGAQQLIPLDNKPLSGPPAKPKQNFSPTKFTIMKQSGAMTTSSGGSSDSSVTLSAESSPTTSDYSNILDMPVLFADSDGNIQRHHEERVTMPQIIHSRPTQYFIQTKPTMTISKDATQMVQPVSSLQSKGIVIGNVIKTTTAPNTKPGNVVVLNKNAMRPIITKTPGGQTQMKYVKFGVAPQNAQKIISTAQIVPVSSAGMPITASGKKIEIINSSIIRTAGSNAPFIINMDPSKGQTFKTLIKKPGEITTSTGQIIQIAPRPMQKPIQVVQTGSDGLPANYLIKPNILNQVSVTQKPLPKPTILSRGNLTVKRIISLPPKSDPNQGK